MTQHRILTTLVLGSLLAACGEAEPLPIDVQPTDTPAGKADQISGADDPSGLLGNAERRLAMLVSADEVGQSFGVPEDQIPYPDTYWPMVDNGIAVEWLEQTGNTCATRNECEDPQPSPLEKFVSLTSPGSVDEAVQWEIRNHGEEVPNVASWFGHCPGWVATAMLHEPVRGPVWVRSNNGQLEQCADEEEGCTKFEIGDINALGAEAHEGARSRFIGARCDTDPADIERDEFGRIVRNGTGCKGLNAGAMLILIGNRLKVDQLPFAIDAQNEFTTEQIWNQPAFRYTVNRYRELTEAQAANLVASGGESEDGEVEEYPFNDNARGFAFVDFTLSWVTETPGPNLTVVSGGDSFRTTRMVAVIELDADPSDPDARVIGGEYVDDASVGASRLRVAPFAWIALDAGPDFRHNPFVRADQVKDLLAMATADDDGGGGGEMACEHDPCEQGGELEADCDTCVDAICAADSFCCESAWDNLCVAAVESTCARSCG